MSFVATNAPQSETPAAPIENNGFWPALDIADFRDDERIGHDITDRRVRRALLSAMVSVNGLLAEFQARQEAQGIDAAAKIPRERWQTVEHYPALYVRAVYAFAQADIMERYRDYATRSTGEHRGEVRDAAADDYRRDAMNAIADIEGRTHTIVELI